MRLSELCSLSGITNYVVHGDAEVRRLVMDSRKIQPGDLFVAMPSSNTDAHRFIAGALKAGAVGAVVHKSDALIECRGAAGLFLDDYENNLWRLCKTLYGNPSGAMKLVGVTGTNGKTTTAWILRDMLTALGLRSGYLGTLGLQYPGLTMELPNTTPFVVDLYNYMADARDAGVEAMAIEVSSHALAQKRVEGLEFDVAVFTNLTQDHLDFHGNLSSYERAKWRLFSDFEPPVGCFNVDDPVGARWASEFSGRALRSSLEAGSEAELLGNPVEVSLTGIELELTFGGATRTAVSRLAGGYNVSNLLSASSALLGLGFSLDQVVGAIPSATPVPGRFESIVNTRGIGVIVDYAHTPDALEKLLDAARPLTRNRIITVFGCGGDRDATKRPIMARAAAERSDLTVVTSDNPRTEDPKMILEEVAAGIPSGKESVRIEDRKEAIHFAIHRATAGDTVVIAGKGHEDYQIIGREKIHLDDRETAREALSEP